MVTYKEKSSDEESCQVFVPFVSDVRVGTLEAAGDADESAALSSSHGSGAGSFLERGRTDRPSPPSSPNISKYAFDIGSGRSEDCMELQLDYWLADRGVDRRADTAVDRRSESDRSARKQDPKSSIRTNFRSLTISHLGSSAGDLHTFCMAYTTKEKRPKAVLKIGKKKEKAAEAEAKLQTIDGISRLICKANSSHPLKARASSRHFEPWLFVSYC